MRVGIGRGGHSEPHDERDREPPNDISAGEKGRALKSLLTSRAMTGSPQLQNFLRYIVEETLAGREKAIKGTTIAADVYGRRQDIDERADNIVRVEAGRLRRKLQDHYENEGATDPVRIRIDRGGYVPSFERRPIASEKQALWQASWSFTKAPNRFTGPLIVGALLVAVLSAFAILQFGGTESAVSKTEKLKRQAIMERSPAALQAANLAAQARGLIYPIFDANRQTFATDMFRAAIARDEYSSEAHAGAAQTLATLALLSIEGPDHDSYLEEAKEMVSRAMELAPANAWTQSAAGWVAFVERDFDAAMRHSERALQLAPDDGNVLDFYGVVALFSGHFEEAAAASNPERRRTGPNTRFANRNIFGAANLYLGQFDASARSFEEANENGDPLSPPGVAYLAAAYHGMGDHEKAGSTLNRLMEAWPSFPLDQVFYRLHRDRSAADSVLDRLRHLGWRMKPHVDG